MREREGQRRDLQAKHKPITLMRESDEAHQLLFFWHLEQMSLEILQPLQISSKRHHQTKSCILPPFNVLFLNRDLLCGERKDYSVCCETSTLTDEPAVAQEEKGSPCESKLHFLPKLL